MTAAGWSVGVQLVAWGVAFAWCVKTRDAQKNMPGMTNLAGLEGDLGPARLPRLTVVIPARDEAENIAATLDTLVQQDYPNLSLVAVDDRSTDGTGAIMDRFAREFADRVTVLHITELPAGWLGKTHAMAQALLVTALGAGESEYVLFTDADVLFSPSVLRRSLAFAEMERADHLVTMPTMLVRHWSEGVLLGFFQIFGFWATRLWRVADPASKRDIAGVGAFNMLRRDALVAIGGLRPQRLTVLEDITLARRIKAAGLRSRVAFAPGLVLVHWAAGARGLMKVMSKNLFSAFNFRTWMALGACLWIVVFCLLPLAGLAWWQTVIPALIVGACVAAAYNMCAEWSWIPAKYAWTFPIGAAMFCYAVLRSAVVVWKDGGVTWRGTLYPLRELRQWNSPFLWEKKS